jgi:hypothetical protein
LTRRFKAGHGDNARMCSSSTQHSLHHSWTVKLSHRCHCPLILSQECLVLAIHFTFTSPDVSPVADSLQIMEMRWFRCTQLELHGNVSRFSFSWNHPQREACNVTEQCLLRHYIGKKWADRVKNIKFSLVLTWPPLWSSG